MILQPEKYIELVNLKFNNFTEFLNKKFEETNNIAPYEISDNVILINDIINRGEELDESKFASEDIKKYKELVAEREVRAKKMLEGDYKIYDLLEEDYKTLTVTLEEVQSCLIDHVKYADNLKEYVKEV